MTTRWSLRKRWSYFYEDYAPVVWLVGVIIALLVVVFVLAYFLSMIPSCTTLLDGTTICSRYEGLFHKIIYYQ